MALSSVQWQFDQPTFRWRHVCLGGFNSITTDFPTMCHITVRHAPFYRLRDRNKTRCPSLSRADLSRKVIHLKDRFPTGSSLRQVPGEESFYKSDFGFGGRSGWGNTLARNKLILQNQLFCNEKPRYNGLMLSAASLQEMIQSHGFSHFGIARPVPLDQDYLQFQLWLKAGFNTGMDYLARPEALQSRANPSMLLPEARSIIVLGMRYPVDRVVDTFPGLFGKVSSYAWGQDYHEVLCDKLEKISVDISAHAGNSHHHRIAVDSAPILEKPIARNAGLGWVGRNSCLIHPTSGSFFFLANLFTTVDIEPTPTFDKSQCGTCHRCVDACPTCCIQPDRTIDARRCLSYLTIENKGVIPMDLRENLGQRIFGCDVCQSVCPWNRRPDNSAVIPEFQAESESQIWLDIPRIISLSVGEFKEKFKQTPVLRAKRNGLVRNACVVLGNTRLEEAIPHLTRIFQEEPDPLIRCHAAWGLGRIPSIESQNTLSRCLKSESDAAVRDEIKSALASN
jgi:epoxyqueuosine reductase